MRGASAANHADQLAAWRERGAEIVEADLEDACSLEEACQGMRHVISAVQGGEGIIIDGQTRLLRACEKAGAERMIPSDFALDLFALEEGENLNMDVRRTFDERLKASVLGHTFFSCTYCRCSAARRS